jgi:hypothetical protein
MTEVKRQKAIANLKKVQYNLCEYVDTLAVELSPLVKANIVNPHKLDVYDVIDMCYEFDKNTEVFGDFSKDMILSLFSKKVFTDEFAVSLTRSFRLQLYK